MAAPKSLPLSKAVVVEAVSKRIMQSGLNCAAVRTTALLAPDGAALQAAQLSGVKVPRKIKDVKPVYPPQSLTAGDEGVIVVELKVEASGSVTNARVIWSKCSALNDAALKAVRGWQFEKVVVNGRATSFAVTTEVPFRLPEMLKSRAGRPGACQWVDPPKPIQ
jgi:TonB family protein